MSRPRICVLRAPGTNCDVETAHAFALCGGEPERVHLFRLLEEPQLLRQFQVLCVPGGFSYGDDIGSGVVFASHLAGQLAEAIGEFLAGDKLALGICNGFQVLLKAGVLPGGAGSWPPDPGRPAEATLTWNNNGRYTACWVRLKVASQTNVFLRGIESLELPVAHAEGRICVSDPAVVRRWFESGQAALTYATESLPSAGPDDALLPFPANPNGSIANLAGLGDPTGRVLGLMPHPERFLFATQHPRWTRLRLTGDGQGLQIFRNAVDYFRG
jgi:phosphoribosylformylglycinamidine synthase I